LGGKSGFDDDEDSPGGGLDDEDLRQDSIYTMDMKVSLVLLLYPVRLIGLLGAPYFIFAPMRSTGP
jgi:hypothetical protein